MSWQRTRFCCKGIRTIGVSSHMCPCKALGNQNSDANGENPPMRSYVRNLRRRANFPKNEWRRQGNGPLRSGWATRLTHPALRQHCAPDRCGFVGHSATRFASRPNGKVAYDVDVRRRKNVGLDDWRELRCDVVRLKVVLVVVGAETRHSYSCHNAVWRG